MAIRTRAAVLCVYIQKAHQYIAHESAAGSLNHCPSISTAESADDTINYYQAHCISRPRSTFFLLRAAAKWIEVSRLSRQWGCVFSLPVWIDPVAACNVYQMPPRRLLRIVFRPHTHTHTHTEKLSVVSDML